MSTRRPMSGMAILAILAFFALAVGACDSSTEPPRASEITLGVSDVTLDAIGATVDVVATVLDQGGRTMTGATVTWTSNATAIATVTSAGRVAAVGNGDAVITASVGAASATLPVHVEQVPVAITLAPFNNGNGQSVARGTAVPVRPAVQVTDAFGNGVVGGNVTFTVVSGGGTVTGGAAITNSTGIATVGSWTLGNALGPNTLEATVGALTPILFTVTAIEDPCTPAGAPVLAVGQSINSFISASDCQLPFPDLQNFELFRLDVVTSATIILEMSASFDAWLSVLDFNTQAIIIENDDIELGVIQDSRIVTPLAAGSYLLRARTFDPGQTGTFTLSTRIAIVGAAAVVDVSAGNGQVGAPGATVAVAPAVIVRDEVGTPVAGVPVTFATLPGVGSASGTSAVTDANGVATVGSWTLAAGSNVLSATVDAPNVADNPFVFSATGSVSTAGFNIALRFVTMPTVNQLQTFSAAAARWESIITGDLPAQPLILAPGDCQNSAAINETTDDVLIEVRISPIDGLGTVLGSAGPCVVRDVGLLPAFGGMRFDSADLPALEAGGRFSAVILHEMGHVLGIGTIWSLKGFLVNPSPVSGPPADTHFNGAAAIAAFNTVGGLSYTGGSKVPVENSQGGAGSINSHWRESVLQNELMTGFLSAGTNPLSVLTIRSLEDLGYSVNTAPADAFFVALSLRAEGSATTPDIHLKDDVWTSGIFRVDARGKLLGRVPKR